MNLDAVTKLLSAKQIRSIAEAQSRINVWDGAIRSGKTIASLLRWLIYVADAPPGELVIVSKTSITAARNVFGPLQDYALFGELASQTVYTPGAPFAWILGRRVSVIGANDSRSESRLRGLTCAGAYVDEASLVPRDFWVQLLGRMSVPGAKLFATTNPDNPAHWLRQDFLLRAGTLDLRNWHFGLRDNPSLTTEYIKAISSEFTGLYYRRFIEGEWVAAEGAVYDMWDEDLHVTGQIPPVTDWLCVAVDYGTTNPLHALLLGLGVNNCLYIVDEWRWDSRLKHRQLTDVEYSARLRDWLNQVKLPASELRGPRPQFMVVDPSAASFKVQLYQDGWAPVDAVNAVGDGIRTVSSLLTLGKLKVSRACPELIAEIPGYAWSDAHAERGEDVPIKANDHGCDALRYAVATTRGLWQTRIPLTLAA